jgi:anti-sigma B factor antagonist
MFRSDKEANMAANPTPISELSITTEPGEGETILHCHGRVTSSTLSTLQTAVRALLPDTKAIVVDLTDVSFMDSMGLGSLVGLYISAKKAGSRLRVVNLNQRIKELFSITHLAAVLVEGRDPDYINMP